MNLTVDLLNPSSIQELDNTLLNFVCEAKVQEFLKKLSDRGVAVMEQRFLEGILRTPSHDTDVDMSVTISGNTVTISAFGKEVGFVEFGTGIKYPEYSNKYGLFEGNPAHGTYGKHQGANPNGWYYSDSVSTRNHTYGNAPAEAMTGAVTEMATVVAEVAREVFGS